MSHELIDNILKGNHVEVERILKENKERSAHGGQPKFAVNQTFPRDGVDQSILQDDSIPIKPAHLAVYKGDLQSVKILDRYYDKTAFFSEARYETPFAMLFKNITPETVQGKIKIFDFLTRRGFSVTDYFLTDKHMEITIESCGESKNSESDALFAQHIHFHEAFQEFIYYVSSGKFSKVKEYLKDTYSGYDANGKQLYPAFKIDGNFDGGYYGMAILRAAGLETPKMLALLKDKEIDLTAANGKGFNVFHEAARNGRLDNIKWLVKNLDRATCLKLLNSRDLVNGNTPLHLATKYGHGGVVELLLQLGVDRTIRNFEPETAADLIGKGSKISALFSRMSLTPLAAGVALASSEERKEGHEMVLQASKGKIEPGASLTPAFREVTKRHNSALAVEASAGKEPRKGEPLKASLGHRDENGQPRPKRNIKVPARFQDGAEWWTEKDEARSAEGFNPNRKSTAR